MAAIAPRSCFRLMQICEAIGWRPALLQPPPCPEPTAPRVADFLLEAGRLEDAAVADDDLLEVPRLPPPRRTVAAAAAASAAEEVFQHCLQSANAPALARSEEGDLPQSAGFSVAQEAAVFEAVAGDAAPASGPPALAGGQALQTLLSLQAAASGELPDATAVAETAALEEPLFPPLTAVFAAERAAADAAVLSVAAATAAATGVPATAAALALMVLPENFPSSDDIIRNSMMHEEQSARLPHVHIDDAVGPDAHSAESGVAAWGDFSAECGAKPQGLAALELRLDWSLTGPPGSGVTAARHRATPQVPHGRPSIVLSINFCT